MLIRQLGIELQILRRELFGVVVGRITRGGLPGRPLLLKHRIDHLRTVDRVGQTDAEVLRPEDLPQRRDPVEER
jgi:hypothetical protein